MANEQDETAKKAADTAAARKAAREDAKRAAAKAQEKRDFTVVSGPVHHDQVEYAEDDVIELTRAQFEQLKAAGAVAGDWSD